MISAPVTAERETGFHTPAITPPLQQSDNGESSIQFMSDLHLESSGYSFAIPVRAKYLILAGDIGCLSDEKDYLDFLRRVCGQFERTLLIPGNHEFYGSFRGEGLRIAASFEVELGDKFKWMNRKRVDLEDGRIVVLGCTLHSKIPIDIDKKICTRDFARIGDWKITDHNDEHDEDREWLKRQIGDIKKLRPESRIVVATHFAPSFERTCDPRHPVDDRSYCYCSNLLEDFQQWDGADQVTHFIFGHTHWNTTFLCGRTLVLSNQKGLREIKPKWDRDFNVEATI